MKNNREQHIKSIIIRLEGLASGKVKPKDKQQSLSNELSDFIGDSGVVSMAFEFMKDWPEFSGVNCAPIGNGIDDYLSNDKHWSGSYGDMNKKLCKYLAGRFKKELGMNVSNMRDINKQDKTALVDFIGFWPWQNKTHVKVQYKRGFCGLTEMWHLADKDKHVPGYPETHDELTRLWRSNLLTPESVKPSADDAPKWAKYLCFCNSERKWVWHDTKPVVDHEVHEFGVCWWWSTTGKFKYASEQADERHDDWRDTLEKVK